jgi:hypothetical protein
MSQRWEYKLIEATKQHAIPEQLAHAGSEGWELVAPTAAFNIWMTKVVHLLFLKRPTS